MVTPGHSCTNDGVIGFKINFKIEIYSVNKMVNGYHNQFRNSFNPYPISS